MGVGGGGWEGEGTKSWARKERKRSCLLRVESLEPSGVEWSGVEWRKFRIGSPTTHQSTTHQPTIGAADRAPICPTLTLTLTYLVVRVRVLSTGTGTYIEGARGVPNLPRLRLPCLRAYVPTCLPCLLT